MLEARGQQLLAGRMRIVHSVDSKIYSAQVRKKMIACDYKPHYEFIANYVSSFVTG